MDIKKYDLYGLTAGINVLLVLAALALNIGVSGSAYSGPAGGSAAEYRVSGRAYGKTTGPIGVKEPAPVFPVRLLKSAGVPVPLGAKLLGLASFAALTLLTLFFLGRRYGTPAGAIGALFLAANPYFGYYAVKGPAELFPLLFFLGFWYFLEKKDLSLKDLAGASVFAALAALSKIIFLVFIAAALVFRTLEERSGKRLRFAAYAFLLSFAFASPYLAYQNSVFGRPLSLQENLLRQWRNIQTKGPILEAPFEGGRLGPAGFVLDGGSRAAAARFAAGLKRVFVSGLPELAYFKVELFFGLLGFMTLFLKKSPAFAGLSFIFLLPTALIASADQVAVAGGIEPRFYLGVFWLVCCYAGFGFQQLLELLKDFLTRRTASGKQAF